MRIIIEDESCDIIENASLLLERIKEDYETDYRTKQRCAINNAQAALIAANHRRQTGGGEPIETLSAAAVVRRSSQKPSLETKANAANTASANKAATTTTNRLKRSQTDDKLLSTGASVGAASAASSTTKAGALVVMSKAAVSLAQSGAKIDKEMAEGARAICDEVIRDSIESCSEPDYKMELAKLLSGEAKIELYIEHGKLSNAQRLACTMNRPDYVSSIIEEATRLNQNHVKTVCQLWLAKHETRNSIR